MLERLAALACALCLIAPLTASQETAPDSPAPSVEEGARSTPYRAMREFLEACRAGDFERGSRLLDLRGVPPAERAEFGAQRAHELKIVLDRTLWIDLESLSDEPEGTLEDGLARERERIGSLQTRRGTFELVLTRRLDEGGERSWGFGSATVARIPELYEEFGDGLLGEILPRALFGVAFLDVQHWQWIGLILLVVLAHLVSWILTLGAYSLLTPLVSRTESTLDDQLLALTVKPVRAGVALALFSASLSLLGLAVPVEEFLRGVLKGLAVVVVAWLFLRLVDLAGGILRARLQREGKSTAVAVLPLGEKAVKVAILALGATAMLQNLGFNVTGVVAGLGVGGLALALAAQKTIENLFGGVSLILDQPVRVGDFCRFGERVGTVEDVGLRTTKIRTLDRTVVSVPNADFAHMALENFARRDKILFKTKLGLRYETTADQLRWVLAEIRALLLGHPRVEADPGRIRFVSYGDYSLDLEIFAFVDTRDFNEYLAIQEDLLLRIMDVVGASGTGFAFPSSTTYLARDGGNDAERTRLAEERVRAWRDSGHLPFPDHSPAAKAALDDTLDYPPRGSALAPGASAG